jgi:sugar phosphate isomerase/epimerase
VDKALRLMDGIDRSNVKLQLDLYHAQIIQGDLARTIEANIARIGHIQIADNPGRHEPGTGEINYPLFRLSPTAGLRRLGRLRIQAADDDRSRARLDAHVTPRDILRRLFDAAIAAADPAPACRRTCRRIMAGG